MRGRRRRDDGYRSLSELHEQTEGAHGLLCVLSVLCVLCVLSVLSVLHELGYAPLVLVSGPEAHSSLEDTVVVCYYNAPNHHELRQLMPSDVDPHLCTHINVAFARVENKQIYIDDVQREALIEIVQLKTINPHLKILLSIGGAGDDDGFPDMVSNHASRKIFIKSLKSTLEAFKLDGVDLDWEFPGIHRYGDLPSARERQHFSQLLREIRAEYSREKREYLLTVAAPAPETVVDVSYDVDQLNMYTDFVNIMTYDFHSYTKFTPFTGLNSPLYPRASEGSFLATLNINYTVNMYTRKGLDRSKIVVGIPTYGHTFTLVNPDNAAVGSPASGFGSLGSSGFVDYSDVRTFMTDFRDTVTVKVDAQARAPYLYRAREWVSYESPASAADKAQYVGAHGLRGAMLYSLNADEYRPAAPDEPRFPLVRAVSGALLGPPRSRGARPSH